MDHLHKFLEHQLEIVKNFKKHFVTSVSAPRQNGKTYAGVMAAIGVGGKTLFVSRGFAEAKAVFQLAQESDADRQTGWPKPTKVCRTNGETSVWRQSGSIHFMPYSKSGARGWTADTIIFDDADSVDASVLEAFYPAIMRAPSPRILALGVSPDIGLAAHLADRADAMLRWWGIEESSANPALGTLIDQKHLDRAKSILPGDVYRREHLGLTEGEWEQLLARDISGIIYTNLHGQVVQA